MLSDIIKDRASYVPCTWLAHDLGTSSATSFFRLRTTVNSCRICFWSPFASSSHRFLLCPSVIEILCIYIFIFCFILFLSWVPVGWKLGIMGYCYFVYRVLTYLDQFSFGLLLFPPFLFTNALPFYFCFPKLPCAIHSPLSICV